MGVFGVHLGMLIYLCLTPSIKENPASKNDTGSGSADFSSGILRNDAHVLDASRSARHLLMLKQAVPLVDRYYISRGKVLVLAL